MASIWRAGLAVDDEGPLPAPEIGLLALSASDASLGLEDVTNLERSTARLRPKVRLAAFRSQSVSF